jgi:uncharacterized membrane protein YdbT with pleckstrin-like domain
MSYADKLLARDEQILHYGRQHWLAPLSDSLRPIVLVLLGLVLFFLPIDPIKTVLLIASAVLVLVGVVWIGIVYLTWRAEEYIITNRRVLKVEGLLDKKSGDSSLDKINDAVLTQGLLARMLHYGDLEILTANDDAIDKYQMLSHVVDFKKAMLDAKNALEDGYRGGKATPAVAAAPAAPVAAARVSSADDVATTLSKLADLRDKGAITQAEYDQKKAELLGRL